jgi:hypothetical protein
MYITCVQVTQGNMSVKANHLHGLNKHTPNMRVRQPASSIVQPGATPCRLPDAFRCLVLGFARDLPLVILSLLYTYEHYVSTNS